MKAFAIHDAKLGDFGPPFFFQARGQAIRMLQDLVNDPKTVVSQHPEDFRLFALGEFDPVTGRFSNIEGAPELLGAALDYKVS